MFLKEDIFHRIKVDLSVLEDLSLFIADFLNLEELFINIRIA